MTTVPNDAEPARPGTVRRFLPPGRGDARLWLGVGLLAASMLVGALVMSDRSETVGVLQATRTLSAGATLVDVRAVQVPAALAAGYLRSDVVATHGTLRWPVGAGELVPVAAVVAGVDVDARAVTVPVEPNHAPDTLAAGDLVDLWTTPARGSADEGAASRLVLAGAPVVAVAQSSAGFTGALGVTLRVPAEQVGQVVRAVRGSDVDLIAVPVEAQAAAGPPIEGPA